MKANIELNDNEIDALLDEIEANEKKYEANEMKHKTKTISKSPKKSVKSGVKTRRGQEKQRKKNRPRSKTMQATLSDTEIELKSNKKNNVKFASSSTKKKSKSQKRRPKTTKAKAEPKKFFAGPPQHASTPQSAAFQNNEATFNFPPELELDAPKDKMTRSNLKKYQTLLDESSIRERKRIGDSFKLFRQALAEQEKLLCNNLAKVYRRKKEWLDNHLQYIKTNKNLQYIELNPVIEVQLNNESIEHEISLFGSVDLMMPETVLNASENKNNELQGEEMSISMRQKLQLSKLQNATMQKLEQIIRMETEARHKSKEATRLQLESEQDMKLMRMRMQECEQQLLIAKPELDKAMEAVSSIEKRALDEVKVLKKPPAIVEMAMTAVALMLGHKIKNWRDVQKILSYKFIPSVLNYDTEKMLNQNVKNRDKVRKTYLGEEDFTFERVNKGSKVCGSLVIWVRSQIRYSEMLDVVIPMRKVIKRLKKESKRKTKLAKQLLEAVEKLKVNIENYQNECSGIINDIIVKTDEELKNFGDKLEPLNAQFYAILNEIDC